MASPTSNGPLDLVLGLPVHPLVVHAVVVLLPLGALMVIALFVGKRWRAPMAWPTLAVLAVATVSTFLAAGSGEALEERVGDPGAHADWGERLQITSAVLLVVAGIWLVMAARKRESTLITTILGAAAVVVSVVALDVTAVTGHSGAEAAWKDAVAVTPATSEPGGQQRSDTGASAPPAATPSPTGTETPHTMAQVAEHATAESCWAAVDGHVYDLTSWISAHPGGQQRILNLCGTDATSAFHGKHGESPKPNARLDSLRIGMLAG